MKGELHIPDLPEVPVTLSPLGEPPPEEPGERRARAGLLQRLRDKATAYLPLLLMIGLALGTWLLAKNTSGPGASTAPSGLRHEPDYTVDRFDLQRFDATGALKVQIDGDHMRHYPDDDTLEVDRIRVVSFDRDGGRMVATALRGRAKGDGSVVWLDGQAQVVSQSPGEPPVQMNGEHLRAEPKLRRVDSDWPVIVQQGGSESAEAKAQRLEADPLARHLDAEIERLKTQLRAMRSAVEPEEVQAQTAFTSSVSATSRAATAIASAPVCSGAVRWALMTGR